MPYTPEIIRRGATSAGSIFLTPEGIDAGKRIAGWAYNRYKSRKRQKRMETSTPGGAKAVETNDFTEDCALRTLCFEFLPNPVIAPDVGDYNVRDKSRVYYSGYRICREFDNQGLDVSRHYEVNYAIIQWKKGFIRTLVDPDGPGGGDGLPTKEKISDTLRKDFFRENGQSNDRVSDFVDGSIGAQLWEMKYNCNSMNPNKNYKIILRKKFRLTPRDEGRRSTLFLSRKTIRMWLPVKRRLNFQKRSDKIPDAPFMEIWWYNTVSPNDYPTAPANVTNLRTWRKHHLYFRG